MPRASASCPYEAAALGTPTVFTDFGPLREISGVSGLPATWSVEQHAADLVALLSNEEAARERASTALRAAIARHTWAGFARRARGVLRARSPRLPEVATSAVGADSAAADAAALSAILSSRTWRATEPLRKVEPAAQGPSGLSMATGAQTRSLLDRVLFGSPRWVFLAGMAIITMLKTGIWLLPQHLAHLESLADPFRIRSRPDYLGQTRCGRG